MEGVRSQGSEDRGQKSEDRGFLEAGHATSIFNQWTQKSRNLSLNVICHLSFETI